MLVISWNNDNGKITQLHQAVHSADQVYFNCILTYIVANL